MTRHGRFPTLNPAPARIASSLGDPTRDSSGVSAPGGGSRRGASDRGFSLPEVLTVIAVIGVLVAVSLVGFSDTFQASEEAVVRENVERLNNAVWTYSQVAQEIPVTPQNGGTTDEATVLALLRQRDAVNLPGSPYFSGGQSFVGSADPTHYRARWNGRIFVVLVPGQSGSGLRVGGG